MIFKTKIVSKQNMEKYIPVLVLISLVTILIGYFYGQVLANPSGFLLNDKGDSMKNYFCYQWHVQNDTSFLNYSGSNYPFGENHLYTDGTPILSNFIKSLPFLKPYSIAIFNLSMLLSLVVCSVLLYKIFQLFKLSSWQSVISAIGITVLCPQALRYDGHFALSYGFFIPLIIYLYLRFELSFVKNLKKTFLISFISFCGFFIHPYLGMIGASFLFFTGLITLFINYKEFKSRVVYFFIQGVLPFILYFLIVKLTDTHTDRVVKPYGFFYLTSNIESVFISTHKPFRHILSLLYKIEIQNGEGIAYVGITTLISIIILPFLFYKKSREFKLSIKENQLLKTHIYIILASIILLLFSMGYPFKWNANWILDFVPVIQQFRAPGRFAWVFYFTASIAACVFVSKYVFIQLNSKIRAVIVFCLLSFYTIEGIPYHNEVAKRNYPVNYFNENLLDNEMKLVAEKIKEFQPQAIIPLPFFHVGTDYYNVCGSSKMVDLSFIISYHSKVPLMANLTPRNSLSEAQKLIQIVGSDLIEKEIKHDIVLEKPFVILYNKEFLQDEEKALLSKGEILLETSNFIVKKITPEKLLHNSSSERLSFFKSNQSKMIKYYGYYLTDTSYVQEINYDNHEGKCYHGQVNTINTVYEIPENSLKNDVLYNVSFWYKSKDKLDMNNMLVIREVEGDGSMKVLAERNVYSVLNVKNGQSLVTLDFKTSESGKRIKINLEGQSDREKEFYLDNLLIKEKQVDVYKKSYSNELKDSVLVFNNIELSINK